MTQVATRIPAHRPVASARAALASLFAVVLAIVLALLLASCGGGGVISAPATRPLPADFATRKAVAYSPFRTATSPDELAGEVITPAMIKQDLDLLVAAGFGLIRTYDSSDKVAKQTLQVIRDNALDLKVQLGVYVVSSDAAFSNAEVARAIALANEFKDIVIAVSVGNETMVSWSFNRFTTNAMVTYITTVRDAVTQPVTTNDNWAFYAKAHPYEQDPRPVVDVIDFVAMHTYPLLDTVYNPGTWDWRQAAVPADQRARAMMDAALAAAKSEFSAVRSNLDKMGFTAMPIVVGEIGWKAPNGGSLNIPMRTHPVNQKMHFDDLQSWKIAADGPVNVFYFEAFDEPWKQSDDGWGLFNKDRKARYVVKDFFPSTQWVPGDDNEPATAGLKAADAVYYVPPVVHDPITASRYVVYSDAPPTSSEYRPGEFADPGNPNGLRWDAFDVTTAAYPETAGAAAPGDGSVGIEITPAPKDWGWGLLRQSPAAKSDNLSAYAASGSLTFRIKTTYPGKIEIGIATDTQDRAVAEAYLQIGNGDHGYFADGTWRQVSIPLKDFIAANPKLDLSLVLSRFVIADRYAFTGKSAGSAIKTPIAIDAITWSK